MFLKEGQGLEALTAHPSLLKLLLGAPPPNAGENGFRPRQKKRHEQQFIADNLNSCSERSDLKAKLLYSYKRLVSEEVVCLCSYKFLRNR